jgi:hypothetical protein
MCVVVARGIPKDRLGEYLPAKPRPADRCRKKLGISHQSISDRVKAAERRPAGRAFQRELWFAPLTLRESRNTLEIEVPRTSLRRL